MKDNELITRKNIELALLNKGQHSRRYKLSDIWELNYDEIREVLDDVDADVQPVQYKECKYGAPNGVYGCRLERFSWSDDSVRMYGEDFCSKGKRKGADVET